MNDKGDAFFALPLFFSKTLKFVEVPSSERICTNCGELLTGSYCSHCGQKVFAETQKTVSSLVREALGYLLNLEGHIFRSIKTMATRPGRLSLDYVRGRQKIYTRPLSLFLISIVLYLLFPVLEGLNMQFDNYAGIPLLGPLVQGQIDRYLLLNNTDLASLTSEFERHSGTIAKVVLLFFIPVSCLFIRLLFPGRKRYVYDDLILAIEINTFYVLFLFVFFPLVLLIFSRIWHWQAGEQGVAMVIFAVLISYCTLAFRRFFAQSITSSIVKAVLFSSFHFLYLITLHKYLVFVLTMWWIG